MTALAGPAATSPATGRPRPRPWGVLVAATLVFALLVSLGVWQLRRLAWKEALIAAAHSRVQADPQPLPEQAAWPGLDRTALAGLDFTPVRITGRFLPGEAPVYTVISDAHGPLSGAGWWVVSPFALETGGVVLVNRGFVPDSQRDPERRPGSAAPDGAVTLTGLIRPPEVSGLFTPTADPAKHTWFVRDPAVLGPALGVAAADLAPFTVDASAAATPPGGLPQAGETRLIFPNNHLGYAITWFGLAAALAGVTAAYLRRR